MTDYTIKRKRLPCTIAVHKEAAEMLRVDAAIDHMLEAEMARQTALETDAMMVESLQRPSPLLAAAASCDPPPDALDFDLDFHRG